MEIREMADKGKSGQFDNPYASPLETQQPNVSSTVELRGQELRTGPHKTKLWVAVVAVPLAATLCVMCFIWRDSHWSVRSLAWIFGFATSGLIRGTYGGIKNGHLLVLQRPNK
jgi:hypothetical protein